MHELSEDEFHRQADQVQDQIEHAMDASGLDLDMEQKEGSLVLMLAEGSRLVIGRQPASREIWLAAPDSTRHFGYHPGEGWLHDSDDGPLALVLAGILQDLTGEEVELELDLDAE
ncbi:iron donor protein CyaY [Halopseudomonas pelagia]|uniref:iron donor protein CyaY n=1 Tax=Halopseudomonas pelagia TaxID=553151 RepID=UPI0030DB68CF|tara:strand:- start:656 stop:1000 length:345 start_codon:yes stop_codon:yes gene_type:complete